MTILELPSDAPREGLPPTPKSVPTSLPMADVCKGDCPDCPNRRPAEEAK